ncbi:restriction endonuclease subunit S, partial [Helicobacter himalayensis]|uniref:restriction endonuclease subunit S n=1 Tax=Helicobacter himalayensis TaxID=1591088 RepID=UPI003D6DD425
MQTKELLEFLKYEKVEYRSIYDVIKRYSVKAKKFPNITKVYAVSKTDGIVSSLDYWSKNTTEKRIDSQIFSDDTSNYNIIRKGMFAYNPARINIGSIGCLFDGEDGLLSPMYLIFSINEKQLTQKYFFYFIKQNTILNKIDSMKEVGARFRFDFDKWKKIQIPLPPLEVQNAIVEILDKFTALEKELEKELVARRKQYEYYRNKLLSKEELEKRTRKYLACHSEGFMPEESK